MTQVWLLACIILRLITDISLKGLLQLQFLPQDKVVEFARMSPVELLKATQTAISDSRLADLHTELIQQKKSSNVLTRVGLLT